MFELEARIVLRYQPGWRGMRPSFSVEVGGDLITSAVFSLDGADRIPAGAEHDVLIRLPYGERFGYPALIDIGMRFTLNEASRVIGDGAVTRVIGARA